VGQSSSQHDKCEVGNMHTYSLYLVHFPIPSIIQSSIQSILGGFMQSVSCPLYLHVTLPEPVSIPIPICVAG
jgi:hypothetical protein